VENERLKGHIRECINEQENCKNTCDKIKREIEQHLMQCDTLEDTLT